MGVCDFSGDVATTADDVRIGVEMYSNIIHDSIPIYIPLSKREDLKTNSLLTKLEQCCESTRIFLDLTKPFKIVVGIINLKKTNKRSEV